VTLEMAPRRGRSAGPSLGEVLGERFRLRKEIGRGAQGIVFEARDLSLERDVAVKVLRTDAPGQAHARFLREAKLVSQLGHPGIVTIFDAGTTQQGALYYAMELVRGRSLDDIIDTEGALSTNRIGRIVEAVGLAIHYAHDEGLVHRDLKPSNIMLCERGGLLDYVKVLDFGLVRSENQSQDVALTSAASLTGTPLYMSPEAVESPEHITVRNDVYQLGAIAYYMMAERHVFPGDSMVDVLTKHLNDAPEPIEAVRGESVNPELEAIVLQCLEKNPDDRPAHAGELVDMLENCSVPGTWGQREARGWWAFWRENHPDVLDQSISDSSLGSAPSADQIDFKARAKGQR